jgi:hypothetical protein
MVRRRNVKKNEELEGQEKKEETVMVKEKKTMIKE